MGILVYDTDQMLGVRRESNGIPGLGILIRCQV